MKALEFLEKLTKEDLDLEQCGIAKGEDINEIGVAKYFGCINTELKVEYDGPYFYFYGEDDYYFSLLNQPDIILPISYTTNEAVYLWEIE